MNILIVEDDELTAKQLAKLLKHEKYECDVAYGYKEAQNFIDENTYALILLDWNLGDGDGLTLLQEIRKLEIQTPVFMLSANSSIDDRVAVLDSGADDYLCKPYSFVELLARMRALLRRESSDYEASGLIPSEWFLQNPPQAVIKNLPIFNIDVSREVLRERYNVPKKTNHLIQHSYLKR